MLDLSSVARERTVLATVADAIVASAVGKALRVAVACPASQLALIDHLAQALHARGRACRCLVSTPSPSRAVRLRSFGEESDSTVVLISSVAPGPTDDVQRVSIRVTGDAAPAGRDDDDHQRASEPHSDAEHEPDILLDCHDGYGPTIRHIAPHLSSLR